MSNQCGLLFCSWLLVFFLFLVSSAISTVSNYTDQIALLEFKSNLEFNPILAGNWTTSTNFCNWVGVSCSSRRQRVTSLRLTDMNLTGTISPFIGNLSFLAYLILGSNQLHGHLSPEIGRLHRLKVIILQLNELQGSIPPTLSNCRQLRVISLAYNQFDNVIPKELGYLPNLQILYLGWNNLRGPLPSTLSNLSTTLQRLSLVSMGLTSIPPVIFNMSSLLELYVAQNSISGEIQEDFCQHFPKLQNLNIASNQLSGKLPSQISQCKDLIWMYLQNNKFHGSIPEELGTMPKLEEIVLFNNNFNGRLPSSLSNVSTLRNVWLHENNIEGNIPDEFGLLSNLALFNIQGNNLTGVIPPTFFNISTLQIFAVTANNISGQIPSLKLPSLQVLYLGSNQFRGNIPESISNSTILSRMDLSNNMLSGPVPLSLGNLRSLKVLHIGSNMLTGERDGEELSFIQALTNCHFLEKLSFYSNPLNGFLPHSIGNFSSSLQIIYAYNCKIQGSIPLGISSLETMNYLSLGSNNITGNVPWTIGGMKSLQRLYLYENRIEGSIPDELCHLQNMGVISFFSNNFSGPIPSCMYNLTRLQTLSLSSNMLSSSIPTSLWSLKNLIFLYLSSNSLSGELPINIKMPDSLENIYLSRNMIEGEIPSVFGEFRSIDSIDLSHNLLRGSIPESLGGLVTLTAMDLSHNELTGNIPTSLESITSLSYLNLSYNKLSGQIPFRGPFANFTEDSFMGNEDLCQQQQVSLMVGVKVCKINHNSKNSRRSIKKILLRYVVPVMAFLLILSTVLVIVFRKWYGRDNKNNKIPELIAPDIHEQMMISYIELVRATGNFSESNLLCSGSYGVVYKGTLDEGTIVAVKVLNLHKEGAYKSFDAECRVLRSVRHRNLVKVITSCSNPEFRALILQYMPKGSLEKWLYTQNYELGLIQRLRVMLDVALALEYLHHGQIEPVIHCDIKPSNVLLDEEMVGHLGDFGIAKILAAAEEDQTFAKTKTLGTIGYMAPEYGSEGMVSTSGDVYSYGIMLMETMTGKKPTEEMFNESRTLREWVKEWYLKDSVLEVFDASLSVEVGKEDCCSSIIEVALNCSRNGPGKRITMQEVVIKLSKIKQRLVDA